MATILNAYNLSGGDTTSSTFTYSGATRDLDVEIITTSIGGDSTRVTIETSADQTTWVLVPNSEIQINKGSDSYVYHARQWDDGGVLSGGVDSITTGTDERLITPCYAANSKLQIYSPSDSVVGDGTIIYYITAQLITV